MWILASHRGDQQEGPCDPPTRPGETQVGDAEMGMEPGRTRPATCSGQAATVSRDAC